MGCGCNKKKEFGSRVLCKVTNWSPSPMFLLGKASKTAYGKRKDGDALRVYVKDIEATPERFEKLPSGRR